MDDKIDVEEKINRYHFQEIQLILFICATDLSQYRDSDLVNFTECIEGQIEYFFEPEYLLNLANYFNHIDDNIIKDFLILRDKVMSLYSSQWSNKMRGSDWDEIRVLSNKILGELHMQYVEPIAFIDNNLNVDWT